MILRALVYALAVFVMTGIISLVVAGIILLLYRMVRRNDTRKAADKAEAKPAVNAKPFTGKEGA